MVGSGHDDDEHDHDRNPNNKNRAVRTRSKYMSHIFGVYVISLSLFLAWKAMAMSYEQMNRNRSTVPKKTGEEKVC